jgi:Protein of unknown function (DUF3106)
MRQIFLGCVLAAAVYPAAAQPILRPKQVAKQIAKELAKTPAQIPDALTIRLMNMTPEQRERALGNLNPQRRANVEQRLARLDLLSPEQKAELTRRLREFQKLPQDRREAVRAEMQNLRTMRPFERRLRLNSAEFKQDYSPEEVRLMRDVWGLP